MSLMGRYAKLGIATHNSHPSDGSQRRIAAVEGSGQMHQRLSAAIMCPDGDHCLPVIEVAHLLQVSQTAIRRLIEHLDLRLQAREHRSATFAALTRSMRALPND